MSTATSLKHFQNQYKREGVELLFFTVITQQQIVKISICFSLETLYSVRKACDKARALFVGCQKHAIGKHVILHRKLINTKFKQCFKVLLLFRSFSRISSENMGNVKASKSLSISTLRPNLQVTRPTF